MSEKSFSEMSYDEKNMYLHHMSEEDQAKLYASQHVIERLIYLEQTAKNISFVTKEIRSDLITWLGPEWEKAAEYFQWDPNSRIKKPITLEDKGHD